MKESTFLRAAAAAVLFGFLSLAAAGAFAATAPEFDQGVDARGALNRAKGSAAKTDLSGVSFRPAFSRWERDCATISFGKDDAPVSERVELESRFYQERCYHIPNGGQNCHEEWSHTERRDVRVRIEGRGEMLPWERDVFQVCLDGHWLNADVLDASHEYSLRTPDWGDTVEARAGRKVASMPDPSGIFADSFRYDLASGNFYFALKDRWSSHYAGETTVLELKLKRHHKNWFDDTVLTKEVSLKSSEGYAIRFADWADELKTLSAGKNYYVKWRFKRRGTVSRDAWQGPWETNKAAFGAAGPALVSVSNLIDDASARRTNVCYYRDIEKDQCVYSCRDGSTIRRPVQRPDPFDRDGPVIACPQVVVQF